MNDRRSILHAAEELEEEAAGERIAYLDGLHLLGLRILDVGCGNGHSVRALRDRGSTAVGIDRSFYRMSRWVENGHPRGQLIVADAAALPFAAASFDTVISSGMLEHIGVHEEPGPYRVTPLREKARLRAQTVAELRRVSAGAVVLDFPNGAFPVDFWHGDSLGAFRLHPVPDSLNPTLRELRSYTPDAQVTLLPLRNRLRFRQVSHRRWGRLLSPVAALGIRLLDRLPRATPFLAALYPFLVVKVEASTPRARSPERAPIHLAPKATRAGLGSTGRPPMRRQ